MDWLSSLGTLGSILRTLILILEVVLVFNLMIVVHEWGHFLAARWRGLHVDRFQIWFGKPIWKKTINGVQYGLGSIPAGGFVSLPQMAPMESIEGTVETDKPLPPITPLDKIIVAFAGPLFSFALAALFALLVATLGKPEREAMATTTIGYVLPDGAGHQAGLLAGDRILEVDGQEIKRFEGFVDSVRWAIIASEGEAIRFKVDRPGAGIMTFDIPSSAARLAEEDVSWWKSIFKRPSLKEVGIAGKDSPVIGIVQENSPAAEAGLKPLDEITTVNGQLIYHVAQVGEILENAKGQPAEFTFLRNGQPQNVTITPRLPDQRPDDFDRALIGVVWSANGKSQLAYPTVAEQLSAASRSMFNMISKLVAGNSDISPAHMSGPVGIGRVYFNLLQRPDALLEILWFSVILNVNLAIMNLLPFPVLDGGHITMAIGEAIRRKPLQGRVLEVFQTCCALLLFGFIIFVTFKDFGDLLLGRTSANTSSAEEIRWLPPAERPTTN